MAECLELDHIATNPETIQRKSLLTLVAPFLMSHMKREGALCHVHGYMFLLFLRRLDISQCREMLVYHRYSWSIYGVIKLYRILTPDEIINGVNFSAFNTA